MKKSPKVSCVFLAYNQREFVEEAIAGLLAQDYDGPLEIVLSDDASTDGTFESIRGMVDDYKGQFQIILNRNKRNLGIVNHMNSALELSSGELIIPAAGDDVSMPSRIRETVDFWLSNGRPSAISVNPMMIDNTGRELGPFLKDHGKPITTEGFFSPSGGGARFLGGMGREVLSRFGPLSEKVRNEDDQIFFRATLLNGVGILRKSVSLYRQHSGNMSIAAMMRGASDEEWLQLRLELQKTQIAFTTIQKRCLIVALDNGLISQSNYSNLDDMCSLYKSFLVASNACLTNGFGAVFHLGVLFRSGLGLKRRISLLLAAVSKWLYIRVLKSRTTRAWPSR